MGKSQPAAGSIALLDIGSNALRCVLAQLDARPGFEVLLRQRVQTRLGESQTDVLPPLAIEETLEGARRFLNRVRSEPGSPRVLAVATAAVRDASNREALLGPLRDLGVQEVRILSGDEEGRLGAEAALRALPVERGMVVDLGGGSLQVTPVVGGAIGPSCSAPIGVARLLRRFVHSDPAAPSELEALRQEVRARLEPLLRPVPPAGCAVASGGIVNALARLARARRESPRAGPFEQETHGGALLHAELGALRAWLAPMTLEARSALPDLEPQRADVIVVGAIVFEELLALSGYPAVIVSRTSVRDGVLWREAVQRAEEQRSPPTA